MVVVPKIEEPVEIVVVDDEMDSTSQEETASAENQRPGTGTENGRRHVEGSVVSILDNRSRHLTTSRDKSIRTPQSLGLLPHPPADSSIPKAHIPNSLNDHRKSVSLQAHTP